MKRYYPEETLDDAESRHDDARPPEPLDGGRERTTIELIAHAEALMGQLDRRPAGQGGH